MLDDQEFRDLRILFQPHRDPDPEKIISDHLWLHLFPTGLLSLARALYKIEKQNVTRLGETGQGGVLDDSGP